MHGDIWHAIHVTRSISPTPPTEAHRKNTLGDPKFCTKQYYSPDSYLYIYEGKVWNEGHCPPPYRRYMLQRLNPANNKTIPFHAHHIQALEHLWERPGEVVGFLRDASVLWRPIQLSYTCYRYPRGSDVHGAQWWSCRGGSLAQPLLEAQRAIQQQPYHIE